MTASKTKTALAAIKAAAEEEVHAGTWNVRPPEDLSKFPFVRAGFHAWGLEDAEGRWKLNISRLDLGDSNPSALLTAYAPEHAEAFPDLGWLVFRHTIGTNGGTNFNQAVKRLAHTLGGSEKDWSRRVTYLIEEARKVSVGTNNGTFSTKGRPKVEKVPPFVFHGRVREGRTLSIFGPGSAGKTTIVDGLVASACSGKEIIPGWQPAARFATLVLDWDEGREEEEVRLAAICAAYDIDLAAGYHYKRQTRPLHDVADEIGAYIVEHGVKLVIVSPMGKAQRPMGENLTGPVDEIHEILRGFGTTNIIIDHVTGENLKGGALREFGSVRKRDNVRGSYSCYAQSPEDTVGWRSVVLDNTKADALLARRPKQAVKILYEPADPDDGIYASIRFEPDEVDISIAQATSVGSLRDRIRAIMENGNHLTAEELAEELGENAPSVRTVLNRYRGQWFNRLASGKWENLPRNSVT